MNSTWIHSAFWNVITFYCIYLDDPDINISLAKYKYRTFLRERVSFINTANIQSPEILEAIHLNFRLIFMRDTASARWIEEGTYELLMNVKEGPESLCR